MPAMPPTEQQMGGSGPKDDSALHFILVFLSIAAFNAMDIMFQIFTRFKRYHGIYFWSMLAATIGIILHGLGYYFRLSEHRIHSPPLGVTLACGGGMLMITGQSIVMWSRLHLISLGKKDTWLLIMIVAACVVVQGGATALFAGSNSRHPDSFLHVYRRFEIFQVTWFFVQESLISGIYIHRSYMFLRASATFQGPQNKALFRHLILVNIVVIALDITILAFEGAGLYNLQTSWKTLVYSLKLKFEFNILNQLVDFTTRKLGPQDLAFPGSLRCDTPANQAPDAVTNHTTDIPLRVFDKPAFADTSESIHGDCSLQKITNGHFNVEEDAGSEKSIREVKGSKEF